MIGNKYLVVIEKTKSGRVAWDCVEISANYIDDVTRVVEDNPQFYGDCDSWEVISINKEWKIGGSMVDSVGIKVGRVMPQY